MFVFYNFCRSSVSCLHVAESTALIRFSSNRFVFLNFCRHSNYTSVFSKTFRLRLATLGSPPDFFPFSIRNRRLELTPGGDAD